MLPTYEVIGCVLRNLNRFLPGFCSDMNGFVDGLKLLPGD